MAPFIRAVSFARGVGAAAGADLVFWRAGLEGVLTGMGMAE
jgi:hypothetical protein